MSCKTNEPFIRKSKRTALITKQTWTNFLRWNFNQVNKGRFNFSIANSYSCFYYFCLCKINSTKNNSLISFFDLSLWQIHVFCLLVKLNKMQWSEDSGYVYCLNSKREIWTTFLQNEKKRISCSALPQNEFFYWGFLQ